MQTNFEAALAIVLRHEGGYADHPDDPGGATNLGITIGTLAVWRGTSVTRADVKALTREEASAIYRARYWASVRGDALPSGLDLAVFDLAVNSGPSRAIRLLQGVLGVPVDGRIGPVTLKVAGECAPSACVSALCAARLEFLRRLATFPVFGTGWTHRVRDIERAARMLAAAPPPETTQDLSKKETDIMDISKTFLASRTLWSNAIGLVALALSWLGFDAGVIDKTMLTDNLLQAIAGVSFVASTVFRVIATKRLA
jgi:lysozyme family protein